MLYGPITTPACTGADASGAATVTSATVVRGLLYAFYVTHTGDDPDTTDLLLATQGTADVPAYTIWSRADSHANGMIYPRLDACKASDGSALSTNNEMVPIEDKVVLTVAQGNTGDIWQVWLYLLSG